MAQIYAAFSYYYDHQPAFDELLAEQDRAETEMRQRAAADPWRQELADRLQAAQQR